MQIDVNQSNSISPFMASELLTWDFLIPGDREKAFRIVFDNHDDDDVFV